MTSNSGILLYGANGYTGELIAREAAKRNLPVTLSGRSKQAIETLATELHLPYIILDLQNTDALERAIASFQVVLHAAGPFIHTAEPMIRACLKNGVHYLDITGEILVFELAASLDEEAKNRGVMLMPGTGFDVVPTDCAARSLYDQMPDAVRLELAFGMQGGRVSRGTALTAVENLGANGLIRKEGKLTEVPFGYKTLTVRFDEGVHRFCMTIPWGDISTAWRTTKIPNIETYMAIKPAAFRSSLFLFRYFKWLITKPFIKGRIRSAILKGKPGPDEQERTTGKAFVWGRTTHAEGKTLEVRYQLPEAYHLTALSSVLIASKVLSGNFQPGYQTPAGLYGADLILEIPGVRKIDL
jgi:short subunit dehydrogenase-like uncharacterized protein